LNYFGVAEAFNNAAFVAQGLESAHGDEISAYTEAGSARPEGIGANSEAQPSFAGQYAESYVYGYTYGDNTYLNNYASWALSVDGGLNTVSLLLKGDLQTLDSGGYQDNGVYASNSYFSSGVDSYAFGPSEESLSPHASVWPGMAWASQSNTLSMFETITTSAGSPYMGAYGGDADGRKAGTIGTFDFAGVGATGQSHTSDAAFVSKS
jgi:hypothetical protein